MRTVASILDAHGIEVEVLHTVRPGYVVYEDQYQVAAEPFSETVTASTGISSEAREGRI